MKLFVGIDVSSFDLKVCFMNNDGDVLKRLTVDNNPVGSDSIVKEILQLTHNSTNPTIHVGMESTSVYSWHPAIYLNEDPSLKKLNTKVFTINPKIIKDFKEAYNDLDKTDVIDAFIIADRLRFGRLTFSAIQSEQIIAMQRLSRMRFHLIQNLTREKQYFLQNLFFKCSAFKQEVDSSVFGNAILDLLLERYTLDEISFMETIDLANYLATKGKNRFENPEKLAQSIQKAARSSYRLSKCVEDSIDMLLATSIESIRCINKQIKELDKSIARLMQGIPNTLQSIPGIGPVYAAGILAEIGDVHQFKDQAALAKYSGLTWPKKQSGNMKSENSKLIRSGNRYLRYYLVEATNSVKLYDPEFKAFYKKKYDETLNHKHKRALVLTARKLVRLIDALLRNDQLYSPRRKVSG